ncbi:MAG: FAD-dependent oxidoreductase, partial [Acidimicrobiales bacterium]
MNGASQQAQPDDDTHDADTHDADNHDSGTYDVIVIGAGSTGENVADYAHQGGLSVALVESSLVGGDCSYWACMPSKALLRPFEALTAAQAVAGSRQAATGRLDVAAVLKRRDSFAGSWDDSGQAEWVKNAGIELIRGTGR